LYSRKGAVAAVTILLCLAGIVAPLLPVATNADVAIHPVERSVEAGSTTEYKVVVNDADNGIGSYGLTISIDDANVATITDVEVDGNPPSSFSNVTIASDGSSVDIDAAGTDTSQSGPVTIVTVTVRGKAAGQANVSLDVSSVGTERGAEYHLTSVTDATLTVETAGTSENPADLYYVAAEVE